MKLDGFQVELENLPKSFQKDLLEYYQYLLHKYQIKRKQKPKQKGFFKSVNKYKYSLPKDFKFDRKTANER